MIDNSKTILITGATDGIGLAAAKALAKDGHRILVHGRNSAKVDAARKTLAMLSQNEHIDGFIADMSRLDHVESLAEKILEKYNGLDALINNAGVFKINDPSTAIGIDVRFVVNTIAPYLLMQRLLPLFGASARIINVSSAAQSPVNLDALKGDIHITDDFSAYAQSKLALTMWSRHLALTSPSEGPSIIAVNPGSMLGSKMVKEGFGVAGGDINIGADILKRATISEEFENVSGQYFDNDSGQFSSPHPDALDPRKCISVIEGIESVLAHRT